MLSQKHTRCCVAWLTATGIIVVAGCAEPQTTTWGAGHRWRIAAQSSMDAGFAFDQDEKEKARPLYVCFSKQSPERRLLQLQIMDVEEMPDAKSLALRCNCLVTEPRSPYLTVVVADRQGCLWFNTARRPFIPGWNKSHAYFTASQPAATSQPIGIPEEILLVLALQSGLLDSQTREVRFPLTSFSRAAFSEGADGELRLDQVSKIWLGVIVDGPTKGAIRIDEVTFTNEPFRPTRPLLITGLGPGTWSVAQDPAVQSKLATLNEGPDGKPCMRFAFTIPGGRHMFALPSTPMPEIGAEGYKALRFTYKAMLPKGINGLLICLWESGGAQYYAEPPPQASSEWKTVTIPFDSFKLGGWSRDANNTLDLDQVTSIVIGMHGRTPDSTGSGTIQVADIELVP